MAGYKRILLKLSGEALAGTATFGIDADRVRALAHEVADVAAGGVQVGVVVGGGNIFRGVAAAARCMDRVTGDHMGMLATVINSLAFSDALEQMAASRWARSKCAVRGSRRPTIWRTVRKSSTMAGCARAMSGWWTRRGSSRSRTAPRM